MHESEGSVITDIWRNNAANYNTVLRKAAEHEPISRNRCKGASEIPSLRLSMLLTGTFDSTKRWCQVSKRLFLASDDGGDPRYEPVQQILCIVQRCAVFYMRFPEGPRSEGYQRNFNMILAAQRMAHDIERVCYHPEEFGEEDLAQARIWQDKYADYLKTIQKGSTCYKHFYGWMYSEIYHGMRNPLQLPPILNSLE